MNGHGHCSPAGAGNRHFAKGYFWATIWQGVASRMRKRAEIHPRDSRKVNYIVGFKSPGENTARVLNAFDFSQGSCFENVKAKVVFYQRESECAIGSSYRCRSVNPIVYIDLVV